MRVATVNTMNCPRCDAPVKGDYKYCPECACRLRIQADPVEPEARSAPLGGLVLGVVGAALLAAGIFVGYQVLGDRPVRVGPTTTPRQIIPVTAIAEEMALVPEGVAFWEPETVWEAPPEDEVDLRLLRTFDRGEVAGFLEGVRREPERLSRIGRLLRLLHARTRDIMEERVRYVPVRTRAFLMMKHEVTRGQWAEFLRSVEADPSQLLLAYPDLEGFWRPEGRPEWAVYYRLDWWRAVEEHIRSRLALEAPTDEDLISQNEPGANEDGADPVELLALPDVPVPDFIDAAQLDTMTNAEAVKLLYPASWVRMDEGGALYWVLEPGTENLPVTDISWWDAQLFVVWARQKLGLNTLRVPNWAEWVRAFHGNHPAKPVDEGEEYDEKADEMGDGGWRWPWGNVVDPHGCNNLNHTWNDPRPMIRDVRRSYGWHDGDTVDGILNMAGNAAEWTRGSRYLMAGDGENYVLKDDPEEGSTSRAFAYGGSYLAGLDDCSVNGRVSLRKTERRIDVGFRLVLDTGGGM